MPFPKHSERRQTMSKDKAEEKPDMGIIISERAREYRVRQYNERIVRAKSYFDSIDIELAFKSGATMFSTENAQLREALREMVETTEELAYIIGQISRKQDNTVTKAKTLIE